MQKLRRARRPWGSLSREARGQGVSRQRIWQRRQREENCCVQCGAPSQKNGQTGNWYRLCVVHRWLRSLKQRIRRNRVEMKEER